MRRSMILLLAIVLPAPALGTPTGCIDDPLMRKLDSSVDHPERLVVDAPVTRADSDSALPAAAHRSTDAGELRPHSSIAW